MEALTTPVSRAAVASLICSLNDKQKGVAAAAADAGAVPVLIRMITGLQDHAHWIAGPCSLSTDDCVCRIASDPHQTQTLNQP